MIEAIARPKLRDVVLSRLRDFIIQGALKPGDRLPTETDLAALFGVSRLSLREATKSLELLGILEARPGKGLTVGCVNMNRMTGYLGFPPALHDIAPDVLIDTRVIIETGVLPYLERRMRDDPSIHDRLQSINRRLSRARGIQQWVELDIAFHRELIVSAGLPPLASFTDVLEIFFKRFRESVKKGEWAKGIASHQAIIDDLSLGRVDDAETRLRAHIESHRGRQ